MSFSPLYGFGNFEENTINKYIASSAINKGKVVYATQSTGTISVAADYGYFILEEVTTDGPSYEERIAGLKQWDVIVGSPVAVLIPRNGAAVRTSYVVSGTTAPAISGTVVLSDGVYVTNNTVSTSAKGVIIGTSAETGIAGVYDIEIRNAFGMS